MNSVQVVRATADPDGIELRLWVDDERAKHVCVATMRIGRKTLAVWLTDVEEEHCMAGQSHFDF